MRAIADFSNPPVCLARQIKRFHRVVAFNHHVIAHSPGPRVHRQEEVWTANGCDAQHTTGYYLLGLLVIRCYYCRANRF